MDNMGTHEIDMVMTKKSNLEVVLPEKWACLVSPASHFSRFSLAGRRINFEDPAFASKAIWRQNTSDPAICQLCLPFLLNNSKILGKGLIIPLTVANHILSRKGRTVARLTAE